MPRRLVRPSLQRSLFGSALALVVIVTLAMVAAFSSALRLREEIDRDTNAFISEQRTADRIAALTFAQQLEAYRFLQVPSAARRDRFRSLGDDADRQMRQYLFHVLSPAARLQVERMKERHETFEVLAQRAFDLAERGETAAARARLAELDVEAIILDSAVANFLEARVAQRSALQEAYRQRTTRARIALVMVGFGLIALLLALVTRLRHRVLVPLQQLALASRSIRAGDPLARVPEQRYEELEQVSKAFNEMADGVQLSRETVEMQNEELRLSLEQLQETQQELVQHEKLSTMGQMLTGLAHELNNPLSGVLGMAELLRAELAGSPDPGTRRVGTELAEPLEREAVRARDLVRSLLSFARKATGTLGAIPLHSAVTTAVALRAHAFVQAGRRVELDIPGGLFVVGEMQKFQHAVMNVVNNALDAIVTSGGSVLRISARHEGDDMVRVDFDDDGGGFRDPGSVFAAFYTTKPADRGTGLGLTLVQQFIEEFGGSVVATNRPEGGARLTMRMRRAAPPVPTDAPVTGTAALVEDAMPAGDDSAREAAAQRRPRALVVDDEPSLREVQRRLLLLEGFDVLVASSAEEAQGIVAREPLDLVVSDLRMPGDRDGLGLLAWLEREHPALARRSLLVTGDVSASFGAPHFVPPERRLNKPFTRQEYVARIRTLLAGQAP